ncbi:MAG: ABC transporter substrate-binding protein [Proteobacteria bacterium]|nr:ABC transporter substrate-binding protein [Pseudomonadota bacterium]
MQHASLKRRSTRSWHSAVGIAASTAILLGGIGAALAQGTPQRGGTVVIAMAGDPPAVNPDTSQGVPDKQIGCMVYESLVRVTKSYEAAPLLAKSWDISPDGLTYTFHLVDAQWHDGRPFTSDDVKFTLTEVSAKYGSRFAAAAKAIKSIDTPDAHTVVVNLSSPFGPFLLSLACSANAAILPAHLLRGQDVLKHPATLTNPVGTGPFMLTEWVRGDRIVLQRNPNYWKTPEPWLDRIVAKIIPDPSARFLALQAGEVDYMNAYFFSLTAYDLVSKNPQLKLGDTSYPTNDLILFNTRRPPLDDRRVRQALFMALDRDFILKTVFFGIGSIAKSAIDDRLAWAYNPDIDYNRMYPYSPEQAKALLDEAGLKPGADGARFTISLVYDSTRPDWLAWAQVTQRFWQAVGVKVTLEGADRAVVLKRVYTDYDFGATLQAYTTSGDPALGIGRLYLTSAIRQGTAFNNGSRYSNPDVDRLFAAAENAPNQADRARSYRQAQEILARDLPSLTIHQTADKEPAAVRVHGLWEGAEEYSFWGWVWMAQR